MLEPKLLRIPTYQDTHRTLVKNWLYAPHSYARFLVLAIRKRMQLLPPEANNVFGNLLDVLALANGECKRLLQEDFSTREASEVKIQIAENLRRVTTYPMFGFRPTAEMTMRRTSMAREIAKEVVLVADPFLPPPYRALARCIQDIFRH